MKTIDYDRLATSAPIDRSAAKIATGRGENYIPRRACKNAYLSPPKMQPYTKHRGDDSKDFSGASVGRSRVLGYVGSSRSGARWALRCVCGNYFTLKTRTIKRALLGEISNDCCDECEYQKQIQSGNVYFDVAKGCVVREEPTK